MSDIRSRLADALSRSDMTGILLPRDAHELATHLLSLPGIAITALPDLMGDRSVVAESIRDQPMWAVNDAWTTISDEGEIELEADGQMLYGSLKSAQNARDLAAALLAAAVQAQE
jgi:hypothetical protein